MCLCELSILQIPISHSVPKCSIKYYFNMSLEGLHIPNSISQQKLTQSFAGGKSGWIMENWKIANSQIRAISLTDWVVYIAVRANRRDTSTKAGQCHVISISFNAACIHHNILARLDYKPLFRKGACAWNERAVKTDPSYNDKIENATRECQRITATVHVIELSGITCRAVTRRGLWMALVDPSPSCPSSLSPHVYTSPVSVHATQCSDPVAIATTFLFCRAATLLGRLTWSSEPCPRR